MKYLIFVVLLVLIVIFVLVLDKVILMLDWFVNLDYVLIIIVQEKGFFVDVGFEVEVVVFVDFVDLFKLVVVGCVDYVISYQL